MTAARLPLPAAYADPAFMACLTECIDTPELIKQFERLYDKAVIHDPGAFVSFVHDVVYTRLPDEAIDALRITFASRRSELASKEAADA